LSSDGGIEFGQSASQIVTCAGTPINLTITPFSTFTNASDSGTHYFKSVKVSGIPAQCAGVDFKIRAFDNSSSNPLAIFDTNNTVAVVRVISTSSYSAGTGSYGTTVSSAAGSFTTSFDSPVAVSTSVSKLTIETGPQYILNQTVACGGGGNFEILNNVLTSSSAGCAGSITIPVGVTTILGNAFYNKPITGTITVPSGVREIGGAVFYNAANANSYSVIIPSSVTALHIGSPNEGAFYKTRANSITFQQPSGLTSIYQSTFREAPNLASIAIPDGVLTLGSIVFSGTPLTVSPFSNTSKLTDLGTGTFNGALFTSFRVPDGVTRLKSGVFTKALNLVNLTLPNGLTTIDSDAFGAAPNGTPALACVFYAGSNSSVQNFAFRNGVTPQNTPC
jgi:hypothetical protein